MEIRFFIRVNQVLVRLWACLLACLTGCAAPSGVAASEQGARSDDDCCVLSESDPLVRSCLLAGDRYGGWPLRMVSVHGGRVHRKMCLNDLEREKGIRWMPWHQEAMKDVARCEKPRGAASRR